MSKEMLSTSAEIPRHKNALEEIDKLLTKIADAKDKIEALEDFE